jgi:alpha-tubulin suppressor-like RCC1 family protein
MPALVMSGFTDVAEVEAGNGASCLRRMGGEVHCWGDNTFGQLGNGMVGGSASTPVAVVGLTDAVDVALGDGFACAARSTGRVVCWGKNTSGQLGTSGGNRGTIDDVSGLPDASPATAVAASGTHACAVLSGAVWCWGANDLGQLGQGDRAPYAAPVAVVGLTGVTSVFGAQGTSVGPRHTCATLAGGGVSCWGAALFGRLGSGEPLWSATPLTAVVP